MYKFCMQEEILCSSYLAAVYLKERNFEKTVYVVGGEGISQELDALGIKHCGVGVSNSPS